MILKTGGIYESIEEYNPNIKRKILIVFEEYNPNIKRKILIVFDDMIANILSNKKLDPKVTTLFI